MNSRNLQVQLQQQAIASSHQQLEVSALPASGNASTCAADHTFWAVIMLLGHAALLGQYC
jgi:hypothetical protein